APPPRRRVPARAGEGATLLSGIQRRPGSDERRPCVIQIGARTADSNVFIHEPATTGAPAAGCTAIAESAPRAETPLLEGSMTSSKSQSLTRTSTVLVALLAAAAAA